MRSVAAGIPALLVLSLSPGCTVVPYDQRYPEVSVVDARPGCEHEVLGKVRAQDGFQPVPGQSREWATRANMDLAMAELREEAAGLGAQRVVLSQRRLSRDADGHYSHIDLRGVAISECR